MTEPGEYPVEKEIAGCLADMQQLVGGYIQVVYPFPEEVALVCNEEGKPQGLPLNRGLRDSRGEVYDIISGTFFLCAAPADSENFESLTEEQVQQFKAMFQTPEVFIRAGHHILGLPVELEKCEKGLDNLDFNLYN